MLRTMVCNLHRATRILEQDVGNDRCWLTVGAMVSGKCAVFSSMEPICPGLEVKGFCTDGL